MFAGMPADRGSVQGKGADRIFVHDEVVANAGRAGGIADPILSVMMTGNQTKISRRMAEDLIYAWDCLEFAEITPGQTATRIESAPTAPGKKYPVKAAVWNLRPCFGDLLVEKELWVLE